MTHGSDSSKATNQKMGPGLMQPQAMWFARRGWAVAIVSRRGYGTSGGTMEKSHLHCDQAGFAAAAAENASDLLAVYESLKLLPMVDGDLAIATGNSAGGYAAVALGAHAQRALKAVINFSGGWHSTFFSGSCTKSGLVPEFAALGADSHIPELWLYAKNDSLFGPKYVTQVHDAFTSAGGNAELPAIGKSGDDGHYLFSESPEIWGPLVEEFLRNRGFPHQDLDPEVKKRSVVLPSYFSNDLKEAFSKFEKMGPNKAFAAGLNGEWGYSSGRQTLKIATDEALDRCRNSGCRVIASEGK